MISIIIISIISPSRSGGIIVIGNVINGSPSIGILIIVYSLANASDVHYHFIRHTNMQQPGMYPVIMSLPADQYEAVVFVMEEDGTPFSRAAATPKALLTDGNSAW